VSAFAWLALIAAGSIIAGIVIAMLNPTCGVE